MRNTQWLRYGLASLTIFGAGLSAFVVACGDDDSPPGSATSSSSSSGQPEASTSSSSSGGDPDTGPPADQSAKIYFVHAATSLGPNSPDVGPLTGGVRVCFATSLDGTTFTPASSAALPTDASAPGVPPGLYIGTSGIFPTTGQPLQQVAIQPYLMNAASLAQRGIEGTDPLVPRCNRLLTPGQNTHPDGGPAPDLEENKDYWKLPVIPKDTLKEKRTYILAVTGCTSDAQSVPFGFCGNGDDNARYDPTGTAGPGNLKVLVFELDTTTTVAGDELGASVINLSPQANVLVGSPATGPFNPQIVESTFLDGGNGADPDGGVFHLTTPSATGTPYDRNATKPTPTVKLKGLATNEGYFAFSTDPTTGAKVKPNKLNGPSPSVQASTFAGAPTTTELYVNGKSYTFVYVGAPVGGPATVPSHGHFIGFPNAQP